MKNDKEMLDIISKIQAGDKHAEYLFLNDENLMHYIYKSAENSHLPIKYQDEIIIRAYQNVQKAVYKYDAGRIPPTAYIKMMIKYAMKTAYFRYTRSKKENDIESCVSLDALIKRGTQDSSLYDIIASKHYSPVEEAEHADKLRYIRGCFESALKGLTPKRQAVARQVYLDDMTEAEIARSTNTSRQNINDMLRKYIVPHLAKSKDAFLTAERDY